MIDFQFNGIATFKTIIFCICILQIRNIYIMPIKKSTSKCLYEKKVKSTAYLQPPNALDLNIFLNILFTFLVLILYIYKFSLHT